MPFLPLTDKTREFLASSIMRTLSFRMCQFSDVRRIIVGVWTFFALLAKGSLDSSSIGRTMSNSNPLLSPKPPVIVSYGVAVLSVAAAVIIGKWPALHLQSAPVSLFLCAVMFSAWFGGLRPGLLAVSLSTVAFAYYWSRCKTAERGSTRRISKRFSVRSTLPSLRAWAWGWRSAGQSSRRMAGVFGQHQMRAKVRLSSLRFR